MFLESWGDQSSLSVFLFFLNSTYVHTKMQVEIISRDSGNMVEVKYNITLKEDTLSSEVTVSNSRSSQLELTGSIVSHLTVSTPEATYAYGLERSNFINKLPLNTKFGIIPPNSTKNKVTSSTQAWPLSSLKEFFTTKRDIDETKEETIGEEKENYKHLSGKMSAIYTSAPRNFTIIDRVWLLSYYLCLLVFFTKGAVSLPYKR